MYSFSLGQTGLTTDNYNQVILELKIGPPPQKTMFWYFDTIYLGILDRETRTTSKQKVCASTRA